MPAYNSHYIQQLPNNAANASAFLKLEPVMSIASEHLTTISGDILMAEILISEIGG